MKKNIAIIGAGVGGLAAAARLSHQGHSVHVFEKLDRPGGRANIIRDNGFSFDTGPSFVLMPDFFEDIFTACGRNIRDYLTLRQLDISYKLYFPDGPSISVWSDAEETRKEFERIEPGAARAYDRYLAELAGIYQKVRPLLTSCFYPRNILEPKYWKLLKQLKVGETYWGLAAKYFRDERILSALTFQSMFIGVSPFDAPAFYSVITYADHTQKVFHPMGGMHQIPLALEKLGREFGVQYHYKTEIDRVRQDRERCVLEAGSASLEADYCVINADYPYAQEKLLGRPVRAYSYSCSAYVMYWGLRKTIPSLEHHTLFFANDVRRNLNNIFSERIFSADPSFYVHVPTKTDSSLAPEGKDLLYILVPVPNLEREGESIEEKKWILRRHVLKVLREKTGENIEPLIETEHEFVPGHFVERYNLKYGSAFGLAHSFFQSAFFRPQNRDPRWRRIFYVGASTQPGGGLPPVLASAQIVADMIASTADKASKIK